MPSIRDRFAALRERREGALIPFVTGGDPSVAELPRILRALERGGADLIEVGIPFSDPIADGPTIQASSQRALDRGVTTRAIFDAVRSSEVGVPIVYMGYTNTALRLGYAEFAGLAKASGAEGALLSDLTPDEAEPWLAACRQEGLDTVFLAAPTSTAQRIQLACSAATGFVYCVSRTGVTGATDAVPSDVAATVARIRTATDLPVCVGFGISSPEQVRIVCSVADGAVVGSHIVAFLERSWSGGEGEGAFVDLIASLKSGTHI